MSVANCVQESPMTSWPFAVRQSKTISSAIRSSGKRFLVRADEKPTVCGTGISDSSRFLLAAAGANLGHQTAPA